MTDAVTLDGLALSPNLLWIDEFDYTPTAQSLTRTLTGALVEETAVKLAGRPITLSGDSESGWVTRTQVLALYGKLTATGSMTLTLPTGASFTVKFRHEDGTPVEARPIDAWRDMEADDPYTLKIKLITV